MTSKTRKFCKICLFVRFYGLSFFLNLILTTVLKAIERLFLSLENFDIKYKEPLSSFNAREQLYVLLYEGEKAFSASISPEVHQGSFSITIRPIFTCEVSVNECYLRCRSFRSSTPLLNLLKRHSLQIGRKCFWEMLF